MFKTRRMNEQSKESPQKKSEKIEYVQNYQGQRAMFFINITNINAI